MLTLAAGWLASPTGVFGEGGHAGRAPAHLSPFGRHGAASSIDLLVAAKHASSVHG